MTNVSRSVFGKASVIPAAIAMAVCCFLAQEEALAENLDAGFVLNKMTVDERTAYVGGVIEGLAFSRFLRDRPDASGMQCIYRWHDTDPEAKWTIVRQWLERHPDKSVGVLLYAIVRKECGE